MAPVSIEFPRNAIDTLYHFNTRFVKCFFDEKHCVFKHFTVLLLSKWVIFAPNGTSTSKTAFFLTTQRGVS